MSKAYLWRDNSADPKSAEGYRFLVADIVDGTLSYIPRGVIAVANVLKDGRGGTADQIADVLKPPVEKLYGRIKSKTKDDGIRVPWKD